MEKKKKLVSIIIVLAIVIYNGFSFIYGTTYADDEGDGTNLNSTTENETGENDTQTKYYTFVIDDDYKAVVEFISYDQDEAVKMASTLKFK